jgi:hypothetical protein
MTIAKSLFRLIAAVMCSASCGILFAQEPNCNEIVDMAKMVRAKSSAVLIAEKQKAGNSYRSQVVFAARSVELHPTSQRDAILLLNLIPTDDAQQRTWMTFGDSLCSGETVSDMKSLGRLGEALPRDLAKAVLLVPNKLLDYVTYALVSTQDPHSDYAVRMQTVCRGKYREFVKAVERLSSDKRDWLIKHIFNPEGCHALALPEAE